MSNRIMSFYVLSLSMHSSRCFLFDGQLFLIRQIVKRHNSLLCCCKTLRDITQVLLFPSCEADYAAQGVAAIVIFTIANMDTNPVHLRRTVIGFFM